MLESPSRLPREEGTPPRSRLSLDSMNHVPSPFSKPGAWHLPSMSRFPQGGPTWPSPCMGGSPYSVLYPIICSLAYFLASLKGPAPISQSLPFLDVSKGSALPVGRFGPGDVPGTRRVPQSHCCSCRKSEKAHPNICFYIWVLPRSTPPTTRRLLLTHLRKVSSDGNCARI